MILALYYSSVLPAWTAGTIMSVTSLCEALCCQLEQLALSCLWPLSEALCCQLEQLALSCLWPLSKALCCQVEQLALSYLWPLSLWSSVLPAWTCGTHICDLCHCISVLLAWTCGTLISVISVTVSLCCQLGQVIFSYLWPLSLYLCAANLDKWHSHVTSSHCSSCAASLDRWHSCLWRLLTVALCCQLGQVLHLCLWVTRRFCWLTIQIQITLSFACALWC